MRWHAFAGRRDIPSAFFVGDNNMSGLNKEYKTVEERITILKNRGLLFKDESRAYKILLENSYFDIINANEKLFEVQNINTKKYLSKIYFEDLYDIYLFNSRLSELTMNNLLSIESKLKNSIAYRFCSRYCYEISLTEEYTKRENFVQPRQSSLQYKWNEFKLFNGSRFINFLKRQNTYMSAYDKLPFWVAMKGISFGTMALLIRFLDGITKSEVQKDIHFDNFSTNTFEHTIYILKEIRNSCAHGEMIYRFSKNTNSATFNHRLTVQELGLSRSSINYMDIVKILRLLISKKEIRKLKRCILIFYLKYSVKGKRWMAKKILGKMGNQDIRKWMTI